MGGLLHATGTARRTVPPGLTISWSGEIEIWRKMRGVIPQKHSVREEEHRQRAVRKGHSCASSSVFWPGLCGIIARRDRPDASRPVLHDDPPRIFPDSTKTGLPAGLLCDERCCDEGLVLVGC